MSESTSFNELVRRVRSGDQDAATDLVRLYEPQVRRAIRVRLTDPRLRQVVESMDVCQSVLANFFMRAAHGEFELETPEQLLKLLATMARNKVTDLARRQHAGRRDQARQVPLDFDSRHVQHPTAPEDNPVEQLAGAELLERVRARLSAEDRYLAEQRVHGRSWEELAVELGATPQALRMRLKRALDRIARRLSL